MKKLMIFFITVFTVIQLYSQNSDSLMYNPNDTIQHSFSFERYEMVNLSNDNSSNSTTSSEGETNFLVPIKSEVGETDGKFSVSLTGGANYSIMFDLPPGIKNVLPQTGLNYNSQSGVGIAGNGWNISGISAISRISSTEFHDGEITGITFTNKDRYALDGQRLILKTGSYGANGSTYVTENYSNLKITAYGTHPNGAGYGVNYFVVQYPDGTTVQYGGDGNSTGKLEWSISKWTDVSNNIIQYNYIVDNGLLCISTISYGKNGTTQYFNNEIKFNYINRSRSEQIYEQGQIFYRTRLLNNIEIRSNGILFKKYQLAFQNTSLGYQKLSSVTEFNGTNQSLNPITFQYDNSNDGIQRFGNYTIIPGLNSNPFSNTPTHRIVSGEFDGDGRMDFILANRNGGNSFNVFTELDNSFSFNWQINQNYDEIIPTTILTWNNKLWSNSQAFTTVKETILSNSTTSELKFSSFLISATGPVFQYEKTYSFPTIPPGGDQSCYEQGGESEIYRKYNKEILSGDFNGDGLSDVIVITKKSKQWTCFEHWQYGYQDCNCGDANYSEGYSKVYFADLNRNLTNNPISLVGQLSLTIDSSTDTLFAVDFNGDGKTDILHFHNGWVKVYSLNGNNGQIVEIASLTDSNINLDKIILPGDYNGDGKADFVIPVSVGSTQWKFYISKGNGFYTYTKEIHQGLTYKKPSQSGGNWQEYQYIPNDFNGDGKTDIIQHFVLTPYSSSAWANEIIALYSNESVDVNGIPSFSLKSEFVDNNSQVTKFGVPVFLDVNYYNNNLEYSYIDGNKIYSYQITKDHRKDITLNKITNSNGVETLIEYEKFDTDSPVYTSDLSQDYPYINMVRIPGIKLVSKITEQTSEVSRERKFQYTSAVSHALGLGFLGFKGTASSSFYNSSITSTWNVIKYNPQLRGAKVEEYDQLYYPNFDSPTTNAFSAQSIGYQTETWANKVFLNLPKSIIHKDLLTGVITSQTIDYDAYKNPSKIKTTFTGGSKQTDFEYTNNANGTGNNYYVGRPYKKIQTDVLGSETFIMEENYSYLNNLLSQVKKKGVGTDWLVQDFINDNFGNVTQKTLSSSGLPSRVEKYKYEPTGRYLEKITDIEGLETILSYDNPTGNLLLETSPLGRATTYHYDNWYRPEKKTDYLGNEIIYSYNRISTNGSYTVSETIEGGADRVTTYDALNRTEKNKVRSFNNQWIERTTQYDILDRIVANSEPYFSTGSPTQWNTISYDNYGRITEQENFTGKTITTSYDLLKIITNDGTRTVTTTKNPIGNTVSVQDAGGTISYSYYPNGAMKTAKSGGNPYLVTTTIDRWGRKASLIDPSVSTTPFTYEYNNYGDLLEETTPNGTTTYIYKPNGKLESKEIIGDNTDIFVSYLYNPNGLIKHEAGTSDGNTYLTQYFYDNKNRLAQKSESFGENNVTKLYTYDTYGRLSTEKTDVSCITCIGVTGASSSVMIKNNYNGYNGILDHITDNNSGATIWKLMESNVRMQVVSAQLGNGVDIVNTYDNYGFIKNIRHTKSTTVIPLSMDYTFNTQKGTLTNRKNNFFNYTENFTYDNLNRLTSWTTPPGVENNTYEADGRIKTNTNLGTFVYDNDARYKKKHIALNSTGNAYYQQRQLQTVDYNAFKKPVLISETGRGSIEFEYGIYGVRNKAIEWITDNPTNNNSDIKRTKLYSGDGAVEMIIKGAEGTGPDQGSGGITTFGIPTEPIAKIITYIGGDAYSAPAMYVRTYTSVSNTSAQYYYLHRDNQGSIMAITSQAGSILERRHFDAWGNVSKFAGDGILAIQTDPDLIGGEFFFDRGYTGHEHFFRVGITHMNGRIYDPKLKSFLSPDNFIQNPYDTQNFNRYGYVLNNPLSYTDTSGEFFELLFGLGNLRSRIKSGSVNNFWDGLGAFAQGFLTGAISKPFSTALVNPLNSAGTLIGLGEGIAGKGWGKFNNSIDLFMGNFYLDENRTFFGGVLQGVSRHSWESPQTTMGSFYSNYRNIVNQVDRVEYFGGATFAINENSSRRFGISMGSFINIDIRGTLNKENHPLGWMYSEDGLFWHEYGHTFQSQRLGLSYLFALGLPSLFSANSDNHDTKWYELQANRWAWRYANQHGFMNEWMFPNEYPHH